MPGSILSAQGVDYYALGYSFWTVNLQTYWSVGLIGTQPRAFFWCLLWYERIMWQYAKLLRESSKLKSWYAGLTFGQILALHHSLFPGISVPSVIHILCANLTADASHIQRLKRPSKARYEEYPVN